MLCYMWTNYSHKYMELELLSSYLNSGKLIENNKKQPRKHKSNMQKLQEFIIYKKVIYHF